MPVSSWSPGLRRLASTIHTEPDTRLASASPARAHNQVQPLPGSVPVNTTVRGVSFPDIKNTRCTSAVTSTTPVLSKAAGKGGNGAGSSNASRLGSADWKISCSLPICCSNSKFLLIPVSPYVSSLLQSLFAGITFGHRRGALADSAVTAIVPAVISIPVSISISIPAIRRPVIRHRRKHRNIKFVQNFRRRTERRIHEVRSQGHTGAGNDGNQQPKPDHYKRRGDGNYRNKGLLDHCHVENSPLVQGIRHTSFFPLLLVKQEVVFVGLLCAQQILMHNPLLLQLFRFRAVHRDNGLSRRCPRLLSAEVGFCLYQFGADVLIGGILVGRLITHRLGRRCRDCGARVRDLFLNFLNQRIRRLIFRQKFGALEFQVHQTSL